MNDTAPEVELRYRDMLMSLSPEERIRMASRMHNTMRTLVMAGIEAEGRPLSTAQMRGCLFERLYGTDFDRAELEKIAARIPNLELPPGSDPV